MCLVNDSYITILMLWYYFINSEIHNLCQIISYITHQYKYSFASSDVFTCVSINLFHCHCHCHCH